MVLLCLSANLLYVVVADVPILLQNVTFEHFGIFNSKAQEILGRHTQKFWQPNKDTLQGSSLQVCPAHITGPRAKVRAGRRRVFPCTPFSPVVEGHYCRQVIGARHDRPAYGLGPGLPRPRGPGLKPWIPKLGLARQKVNVTTKNIRSAYSTLLWP